MNSQKQSNVVNPSTPKPNHRNDKKRNRKALKKVESHIAKPRSDKRPPVFTYTCTACESPVFKKPLVALSADSDERKNGTGPGLGHWRCKCGNKKVNRAKSKPEEKAAA